MLNVCCGSRNESGFSLIELMVVVAILGILATIAIPNFQRFQARAKQKSGQALLSGYYTAMKATHAEYTHYFGDFVAIGFRPEGELAYSLGAALQLPAPPGTAVGIVRDLDCIDTFDACDPPSNPNYKTWVEGPSARPTSFAPPATTRNTFVAEACADLNKGPNSPGDFDCWTLNENKQFVNINPGLP